MGLTKEQQAARDGKLTASGIGVLMRAEPEPIHELWRELTGDPTWTPKDLSNVWPVRLGAATENLHVEWIASKLDSGKITKRGWVITHPDQNWAACTLDGWLEKIGCPLEVKHVNGFEQRDAVVQRYYPQMTWQMYVTGSKQCMFSVIEGAREPVQEWIKWNQRYFDELYARANVFMQHVWNLTKPVDIDEAIAVPVKPTKEYDYSENNLFVSLAHDWLNSRQEHKSHEIAKKRLKDLVPADAMKVFGGQIVITRDRANRLNIDER